MLSKLITLFLYSVAFVVGQTLIDDNNEWPGLFGSSLCNSETPFVGPNTSTNIVLTKITTKYKNVNVNPQTGVIVGADGLLVTAFLSIDYEGIYTYYTPHVVAFNTMGEVLWDRQGARVTPENAANNLYLSATNGLICMAGGRPTYQDVGITCLDYSGQVKWTALPSVSTTAAAFACKRNTIVCAEFTCYSFDGATGWLDVEMAAETSTLNYAVNLNGSAFYSKAYSTLKAYTCQGVSLWNYSLPDTYWASSASVSENGHVFYGLSSFQQDIRAFACKYIALDAYGNLLWMSDVVDTTLQQYVGSLTVGHGRVVIAHDSSLIVLNSTTGLVLWRRPLNITHPDALSVRTPTIDASGTIYLTYAYLPALYDTRLQVYSRDGELLWNQTLPDEFASAVSSPLINRYGSLYILSTEDVSSADLSLFRLSPALDCPAGYYDPGLQEDGKGCARCAYPTTNFRSGQTECPNVWLDFSPSLLYVTMASLAFIVLISAASGERRLAVLLVILPSAFDFCSDLAYIMTNKFYSPLFFWLSIVLVFLNVCAFALDLTSSRRYPRCMLWKPVWVLRWWENTLVGLGEQDDQESNRTDTNTVVAMHWQPHNATEGCRWPLLERADRMLRSVLPKLPIPEKPSDLLSLAWFCVAFALGGLYALVCLAAFVTLFAVMSIVGFVGIMLVVVVSALPMLVLRLPLMVMWFLLGAVLHATKALSIRRVWVLWAYVWSASAVDISLDGPEFDTEAFNSSLLQELVLEALPQFIVQSINNTKVGAWSDVAITSASVSAFIVVDTLYRLVFAAVVDQKSFEEIPVKPVLLSWIFKDTAMAPGKFGAEQEAAQERPPRRDGWPLSPATAPLLS